MGERADELTGSYDPDVEDAGLFTGERAAAQPLADDADTLTGDTYAGGPQPVYTGDASDSSIGDVDTDMDGDDEVEATRHQIEQTRSEMSETIDAIQNKLSPSTMVQDAKEAVRDATIGRAQDVVSSAGGAAADVVGSAGSTAAGMGSSIVETIKQNPVPAALAGISIGWLIMSRQQSSTQSGSPSGGDRYRYRSGYPSSSGYQATDQGQDTLGRAAATAQGAVGNAAGQVQDSVGTAVNQAQETVSNTVNQAQDTASQVANQVQSQVAQLGYQTRQTAQQATTGIQRLMDSNPLAVGAAAVAVGLAVGLAVPETSKEDELMGEARASLADRAQQVVADTAQKVQTVAQEAAGAAKEAAQEQAEKQGLTS